MLLRRDERINWHAILLDLVRLGWTLKAIAGAINVPPSTLKGWWYDGKEPRFEDGRALIKFHEQEMAKSRKRGFFTVEPVIQSASHARSGAHPKENAMPPRNKPKTIAAPGEELSRPPLAEEPGESNVDEAIAAAQSGRARRIAKPKPEVEPSPIKGDPERPASAPVNAKREMSYADAMAELDAGTLKRSVLTEKGWVQPPNPEPPKGAR